MDFMVYASQRNKHYTSKKEFKKRMDNWKHNHERVLWLNQGVQDGGFSDNFTSDMDDEEYSMLLGTAQPSETVYLDPPPPPGSSPDMDEDEYGRLLGHQFNKNWIREGKVTPVKSQKPCSTCWIFAATTVQESMQAIKDGSAPDRLSE